jgi:hypothetical protein
MNGLLISDVEVEGGLRRRASSDASLQQLPTPSLTPLLGSPLLPPFRPTEDTLFETLEERLESSAEASSDAFSRDASRLHIDGNGISAASNANPPLAIKSHRAADGERKRSIGKVGSPRAFQPSDKVLKLSSQQIQELTNSPTSIPIRHASPTPSGESSDQLLSAAPHAQPNVHNVRNFQDSCHDSGDERPGRPKLDRSKRGTSYKTGYGKDINFPKADGKENMPGLIDTTRPGMPARTVSTPPIIRRKHSHKGHAPNRDGLSQSRTNRSTPAPLNLKDLKEDGKANASAQLKPPPPTGGMPSPTPTSLPLPPMSIPTYLQLELASDRPSPLYIHRSSTADQQYESSAIKFERLENFLLLPPQLERVLWFGALACLDAWLYTFTILPLRFFKALSILAGWWIRSAWTELCILVDFVYQGLGRVWRRRRLKPPIPGSSTPSGDEARTPSIFALNSSPSKPPKQESSGVIHAWPDPPPRRRTKESNHKHRRTRSAPSLLQSSHKADLLKGLLILFSCFVLMHLDPSRMYHNIRGQAAIKLYVIYNVLEVADRLLSAIGQDILECLFSSETLARGADGRSKLIRPLWVFVIALIYNCLHAAALFYQVITLNVAVNSYSNALLTLLMSNQFVEIKGTVFKKFEKDNLFQLTCADVVERFQLWLMLLIIAMRNIVEVGGLTISLSNSIPSPSTSSPGTNTTGTPFSASSIIPKSFTIFPKWTGQVLGPFLLVLGSEMLVDWLKHAYISKFNNTKPNIYGRFLDVLAKDYYSNAFADQNLTKRLGLPVYALACLFIRASVQTYHMFLATHMPFPLPNMGTSLVDPESETTTPATTAALAHIDKIFRRALGRSTFGAANESEIGTGIFSRWTLDDVIAFTTMLLVFLVFYLLLLAAKLVLGMVLLSLSRRRYKGMKEREKMTTDTQGKRLGGWGVTEVDDDKKRWIYVDDEEALKRGKERERRAKEEQGRGVDYGKVMRYDMVAKRIW